MPYTLSKNGDNTEKRYWPWLKKTWPNYELLWQEFVVPLTGRPFDIKLRKGTDPLLEEICMAHYSIFYHLGRAHELFQSVEQKAELPSCYDDIFFHMSAATEMVDRFLFALWKINGRVQGQTDPEPLSLDEVVERARGFQGKKYKKGYERYLDSGRSVSIPLHNVRDLQGSLISIVHAEDLVNEVWQIADHIRSYRNVMTHNPLIGQLIGPGRAIYLPEQDKLSKYRLWSHTFYGETVQSDYVPASDIVEEYLFEFESRVNKLWQKLIELLRDWSETEQYKGMLLPEPERPTVAHEEILGPVSPGEAESSWPSGTASAPWDLLDADDKGTSRGS